MSMAQVLVVRVDYRGGDLCHRHLGYLVGHFRIIIVSVRGLLLKHFLLLTYIMVFFALDIDECAEGTHNCAQQCVNTQGGFNCSCYSGYDLMPDGTCKGKYHVFSSESLPD